MRPAEDFIEDLAGAILDGAPIDWAAAESSAEEPTRLLVRQLRLLAAVADVHRESSQTESTASWVPQPHEEMPKEWGHLRLIEQVGRGAFGQVYRGWDTRLDREVALKLLPADRSPGGRVGSSIIREGKLLARVRHPNVVTIYGAEQIGAEIGLWMEFVRGHTLEQLIARGTVFTAQETAHIGVEVCRAVSAVHNAGLLHRDIKAHNVTRDQDGRLVLMDFGTGREVDDNSASDLTGTPLYLAPEVLAGEPATVQSDIYSVGVLLYHVASHSYPVRARSMRDMRAAHDRNARMPVRTARPDLPAALARVIERATDPRPERRHPTADALAADLVPLAPQQVRSPRRRWMRGASLAACIALATLAAADTPVIVRALPAGAIRGVLVSSIASAPSNRDLAATVQQVVSAELDESSVLRVFPPVLLSEALERLGRPRGSPIDESLGLDICEREGLPILIAGSVEPLDDLYIVRLRAMQTGTRLTLAAIQEGHKGQASAVRGAVQMARRLRQQLGEAVASIQSLEPIAATSESYEAQRQFALGKRLYDQEQAQDALTHFLAAVSLDPEFASAHAYAGLAYGYLGKYDRQRESLDRAAELVSRPGSRVGQVERVKILADRDVHLERLQEAAAHGRRLLELRPGDGRLLANLGLVYGSLRNYPDAIDAFERALRAYPHSRVRSMLADMYTSDGRPGAAVDLLREHLDRPMDLIEYAGHLQLAGRASDAESALEDAERRSHLPGRASWSDLALAQADFLRSQGRYREAEEALQQGLDRGGTGGVERLELAMASLLVDWGRRPEAIRYLRKIDVELARHRIVQGVLAARAGDLSTAAAILTRLEAESAELGSPRPASRAHQLRAEIPLTSGRAAEAHEQANQASQTFETAWTLETLARAQQKAGLGAAAITTWTTVLQHAGERAVNDWDAPAFSQVVIANYHLARLLEREGRVDEARERYDAFLRLWERADPGLPMLTDARERRRRLGQGAQSTPSGRVPKPAAYSTDSATPSIPRSRSITESASAIVQNGARPSHDAVRQNVWHR